MTKGVPFKARRLIRSPSRDRIVRSGTWLPTRELGCCCAACSRPHPKEARSVPAARPPATQAASALRVISGQSDWMGHRWIALLLSGPSKNNGRSRYDRG